MATFYPEKKRDGRSDGRAGTTTGDDEKKLPKVGKYNNNDMAATALHGHLRAASRPRIYAYTVRVYMYIIIIILYV